jgi:hypothetical protein
LPRVPVRPAWALTRLNAVGKAHTDRGLCRLPWSFRTPLDAHQSRGVAGPLNFTDVRLTVAERPAVEVGFIRNREPQRSRRMRGAAAGSCCRQCRSRGDGDTHEHIAISFRA